MSPPAGRHATFAWIGARWPQRAACADHPTDLWSTDHPTTDTITEAKAICSNCPARTHCAEDADRDPDAIGIRAGLTHTERRQARGAT